MLAVRAPALERRCARPSATVAVPLDIRLRLAGEPGLAQVVSYWATGAPALTSRDGAQALVLGRITGDC
jgi:RND superfamily putative drug exporter